MDDEMRSVSDEDIETTGGDEDVPLIGDGDEDETDIVGDDQDADADDL